MGVPNQMTNTVLLVEDERGLVDSLTTEFQFEDYQVISAFDGESAVTTFLSHLPDIDLVVLDWMLPKLDGLGVLRRIRKESDVPVIMLTARDYTDDKVAGLLGGADDYVTKPFDTEELLARMQVVLRRPRMGTGTPENGLYRLDDLTLDATKRQVIRGSHNIQLTQREFNLLHEMFKDVGKTSPVTSYSTSCGASISKDNPTWSMSIFAICAIKSINLTASLSSSTLRGVLGTPCR